MIWIQNLEKHVFQREFVGRSIFAENQIQWIHALMAVFGTNYEMSFDGSKQVPKETQLAGKNLKISHKQKSFIISLINGFKLCCV